MTVLVEMIGVEFWNFGISKNSFDLMLDIGGFF